jgi:hypothetical protein
LTNPVRNEERTGIKTQHEKKISSGAVFAIGNPALKSAAVKTPPVTVKELLRVKSEG